MVVVCVCGGSSESLLWRMIGRLERLAWNDEPFDRRQVTPGGLRTSLFVLGVRPLVGKSVVEASCVVLVSLPSV